MEMYGFKCAIGKDLAEKCLSLQTTRQLFLVHLDVVVRVALVNDATILLLLDRYRQLKVHHTNVCGHIDALRRGIGTLGPGALVWPGGQMDPFVSG